MKYLHIILANLRRKKFRLVLTIGSFAVALFLLGLLVVIDSALSQGVDVAGADRLVVLNKISLIMPLPYGYRERIRRIDGVAEATFAVWFGGVYQDPKNFFPTIAVEKETWRTVYAEVLIPDGQWENFLADRQACIVGSDLADRFGFEVGDRIPLEGSIWTGTWEFNVAGIYDQRQSDAASGDFYFRYDYLEEMRPWGKGTVGWFIVKIADPDRAPAVAAAIDDEFANSPWETKAQTEKAFAAGFARQIGNIRLILSSIGLVVFATLLLVTGNTMAISVRERTGELAVYKTLGFTARSILAIVLAESMLIAGIGGVVGMGLAKLFTLRGDPTGGLIGVFYLAPDEMAAGVGIALAMGLLAGLFPGIVAMRLRIVEAFRRI